MREKQQDRVSSANKDIRIYVIAIAIFVEAYFKFTEDIWAISPIVIGSIFLAYFSLIQRAMLPFANGLMFLVYRLGRVNNWLILSVVFYCFITPFGYFMRKLHGNRLELGLEKSRSSYWETRQGKGEDIDFEKMY